MNEHTPTPWAIDGPSKGIGPMDDGGDFAIYVERDGYRHIIGEVISRTSADNREPAEANAHLIVRAVNNYERLVAALRKIAKQMTSDEGDREETEEFFDLDYHEVVEMAHDNMIGAARAALADLAE